MPGEPNRVVCRCEDVTLEEIKSAIRAGARDCNSIKRLTRAGMGVCQGYTCERLVQQILEQECGKEAVREPLLTVRPPIGPMTIANIIDAGKHET
jgi:NAD(P)H-nitrite reductase large subunit